LHPVYLSRPPSAPDRDPHPLKQQPIHHRCRSLSSLSSPHDVLPSSLTSGPLDPPACGRQDPLPTASAVAHDGGGEARPRRPVSDSPTTVEGPARRHRHPPGPSRPLRRALATAACSAAPRVLDPVTATPDPAARAPDQATRCTVRWRMAAQGRGLHVHTAPHLRPGLRRVGRIFPSHHRRLPRTSTLPEQWCTS
ncbi:unnamed protein product, partial [Urochloa humidicola]